MVGVTHAEDGELGLIHRVTRSPVEGKRAALSVDISRRPVRKQLVVSALEVRALRAAGQDLHVVKKVGIGVSPRGVVRLEAVVAGEIKEQSGLARVRSAVWFLCGASDGYQKNCCRCCSCEAHKSGTALRKDRPNLHIP